MIEGGFLSALMLFGLYWFFSGNQKPRKINGFGDCFGTGIYEEDENEKMAREERERQEELRREGDGI